MEDPQYFIDEYFYPLIRDIDLYFEKNNDHNNPMRFKLLNIIKHLKNQILDISSKIDNVDEMMLTCYSTYDFKDGNLQMYHSDMHLTKTNFPFALLKSDLFCSGRIKTRNFLIIGYLNICSIESNVFDNYRVLDLAGNKLTTLPSDVFDNLVNCEELGLSKNQLKELPSFDNLINCRKLYLNGNQLTTLPEHIFDKLTKLELLDLSKNMIEQLPINIFKHSIDNLYLHTNKLKELPSLDNLINCKTLDLSENKLTTLSSFDNLINCKSLDLGENKLTTLPSFDKLTKLEMLDISGNKLTTLSENIFDQLTKLDILNISRNELTTLPENIFKHNINCLFLQENKTITI